MRSQDPIVNFVCADLCRRSQLGVQKYGCTTYSNPLELLAWLNHAYEECLDQAVYLRRAMLEVECGIDDKK